MQLLTVATKDESAEEPYTGEDPYLLLGLTGERYVYTSKDIKIAYRKMAMKHHPDRGGNKDVFAKITGAYELLSNSVRRKRFDETGFWGVTPEMLEQQALGKLTQLFSQVLDSFVSQLNTNLDYCNPVTEVETMLHREEASIMERLQHIKVGTNRYKTVIKRLKSKRKVNPVISLMESRIQNFIQARENLSNELQVVREAKKQVKDYSYETESAAHIFINF